MASPPHHHIITFLVLANIVLILALGASSSSSSHYHAKNDFLRCLTDQFGGSNLPTDIIYTPQNETFASLWKTPNLRVQPSSSLPPDLIVTPSHASEIQATVYCSRKLGRLITVRSGGHDFEGLSYTSSIPFVLVDMRNFRSVRIDDVGKTAWVQVGATLGQFYSTISMKSKTLAFPAGICPTVGVGGHLSGGGYSMMSRKHSLAADHIIDAILINADGEVLDREAMGEDLFWAIRGGGGTSFGIVLEFRVTLVTIPETVTVFNVTRLVEQNATDLVHRWQFVADKLHDNLQIKIIFKPTVSPTTGKKTAAATFVSLFLGRARELLQIMPKQFPELGVVEEDCIEMSWIESVLFFVLLRGQPLDVLQDSIYQLDPIYLKQKSDFVSTPIPVDGLRGIWDFLVEDSGSEMQLSPYGGAINAFSEWETPFPHRRGTIFMIEYQTIWAEPEESELHLDWLRRLHGYMEPYVTKSPRAAYVNYRDLDIGRNNIVGETSYEQASVWGLRYFKNNFPRLVGVKTRVDPSNFFRNEQSIPPLILSKRDNIVFE